MLSEAMPLSRRSHVLPPSSLAQTPPLWTPAKIPPVAESTAIEAMCLPSSMRRDSLHLPLAAGRVSDTMPLAVAIRTSLDGLADWYRFLPFGETLTVIEIPPPSIA